MQLTEKSRDETAFSVDAETGAPSAPQGDRERAAVAMTALDKGHVDEAGYHQLLEDDEALSAYDYEAEEKAAVERRTEAVYRDLANDAAGD